VRVTRSWSTQLKKELEKFLAGECHARRVDPKNLAPVKGHEEKGGWPQTLTTRGVDKERGGAPGKGVGERSKRTKKGVGTSEARIDWKKRGGDKTTGGRKSGTSRREIGKWERKTCQKKNWPPSLGATKRGRHRSRGTKNMTTKGLLPATTFMVQRQKEKTRKHKKKRRKFVG